MIKSMTGFGTSETIEGKWRTTVRIRTVNNRYLSVKVHSLHERPQLQVYIEKALKDAFRRGKLDIWVDIEQQSDSRKKRFFDVKVLRDYLAELQEMCKALSLAASPSISDLIQLGAFQPLQEADEELWPVIEPAIREAISAVTDAREKEGSYMGTELKQIMGKLSLLLTQIKERLPMVTEELRSRLRQRVDELAVEIDPDRLEAEIVLLAERSEVREEVVRLETHIERVNTLIKKTEPVGQELDFLAQELLRETNTLGSKSKDLQINSLVIDMKVQIERFREQVRNVE